MGKFAKKTFVHGFKIQILSSIHRQVGSGLKVWYLSLWGAGPDW